MLPEMTALEALAVFNGLAALDPPDRKDLTQKIISIIQNTPDFPAG
jgi:hypothetical protein